MSGVRFTFLKTPVQPLKGILQTQVKLQTLSLAQKKDIYQYPELPPCSFIQIYLCIFLSLLKTHEPATYIYIYPDFWLGEGRQYMCALPATSFLHAATHMAPVRHLSTVELAVWAITSNLY